MRERKQGLERDNKRERERKKEGKKERKIKREKENAPYGDASKKRTTLTIPLQREAV